MCDDIQYAGIGEAIAGAIREIVLTGTLGKLEKLRAQAPPVLASITNYPRLDPKRVARVYKKFKIGSVEELRASLESGDIEKALGNSIEEMAAAARDRGYEYIGITDHSQSLKIARGLSSEELWAQIRYIDRLNTKMKNFRILKSSEVDILADGSLDYPDEILRELDYTRSVPSTRALP